MLHNSHVLAAGIPVGDLRGIGILGNEGGSGPFSIASAALLLEKVLSIMVGVMTVVAGIWFLYSILGAAIQWLAGGSDKQAIQSAQKKIINSVIGLFLTVAAYLIVIIIGKVLGLNITSPAEMIINNLHP